MQLKPFVNRAPLIFITRVRQSADQHLRDLPAAALTAYARAEDRMKSLQSGFHMHLSKPVEPVVVASEIAAIAREGNGSFRSRGN